MLIKKRRHRTGSRILTVLLAATMLVTTLPPAAFAAQTGSSDADRTVFDALGFQEQNQTANLAHFTAMISPCRDLSQAR